MAKEEVSKVQKIFNAYVSGNWKTMNWTSDKAHHAWSDFWSLLIKSGFAFEKTDFLVIRETCSYCTGSHYDPRWYGFHEEHYALAIRCGNLTFAYALEKLWGRIPFIGFVLDYDFYMPNYSSHATQLKASGRLVLGTKFGWKGETVKVTSFNDKKHSLIACAYHPDPRGYTPSKVKKRFTITVEDFKQEMSKRRKDLRGKDAG